MRSGIDNGPYTDFGAGDDAVARYVDALAEVPLVADPGTMFGYSNAGTVVAGRIVEQLTGLTWETALRTRVLDPAGLTQSAVAADELPFHHVAVGHDAGGRVTKPWSHPRSLAPAGSTLCASAGDLVRFARALRGDALLSPASLEQLQSPQVDCPPVLLADKWCAGAFWRDWGGRAVVGHSGTNLSGSSTLLWVPELGVALATVVNVPRLGYPLAAAIIGELFPDLFGIAVPSTPEPDETIAVDTDALVGRYGGYGVEHLVEADAEGLRLTTSSTLGLIEPIRVRLLPIGPATFVPDDIAATGNRGYAINFPRADAGAPASHLLHGVFLTRRIAPA
jgi:CubicO group peptidase (beta-lactamase class C family)